MISIGDYFTIPSFDIHPSFFTVDFLVSQNFIKKQPLPFSKHVGKRDFLFFSLVNVELLKGQTVRVSITQVVTTKKKVFLHSETSTFSEKTYAFKRQTMEAPALMLFREVQTHIIIVISSLKTPVSQKILLKDRVKDSHPQ